MGFKREFSKLIGFLLVALIVVGLVFNAAGVKDVLLELFNKIVGSGFRKQLELKKFKLFFLCIMHKEEGEKNDKPRVV